MNYRIDVYTRDNGRCPFEDFISGLPSAKHQRRINNAIDRLKTYGTDLGRPYVGFLRDHIWELRIKTERVNYRILFFIHRDEGQFVLLYGIKKQRGKVPDSDIEKAIEYMNDYLARWQGRLQNET